MKFFGKLIPKTNIYVCNLFWPECNAILTGVDRGSVSLGTVVMIVPTAHPHPKPLKSGCQKRELSLRGVVFMLLLILQNTGQRDRSLFDCFGSYGGFGHGG